MRSRATEAAPREQSGAPATRRPRGVPAGIVGAAAVLLAMAGTLLWAALFFGPYRLGRGLLDSADHLERAEAMLSDGKFTKARYETMAASAAAHRARAGLQASGPLLDVARAVARVDAAAEELPHLVSASEHSASAARGTLEIAEGALRGPNRIIATDSDGSARVRIDRIEKTAEVVDGVREDVQRVLADLRAIDLQDLPRRARRPIDKGIRRAVDADEVLADAQAGFALLPTILGADGPRTYLFGMQNPAELRGTGGALLRFAELTLDDGKAELHKPRTVYKVDVNRQRVSIPLPRDAWYVDGIGDAQRFGNANWSPDWPLSAKLTVRYGEKTAELRRSGWPQTVDGFIAVDPVVMQEMLQGVGRYTTRGGRPMTSKKVLSFLLYKAYAQVPFPGQRRALLNEIVDKFYTKALDPDRPAELVRSMSDVLAHKHMQIWLSDRAEQTFIERMNWDGAIEPARRGDYFYVVQQNVGGNKLNYFEDQVHKLNIELDGDDSLVSSEIRIFNGVIQPIPRYSLGDSNGLHRPMINLYVPQKAELQSAPRTPDTCVEPRGSRPCRMEFPEPAVWTGDRPAEHAELGKKVWTATLEIPPQQESSVGFDYRVPGVVRTQGDRRVYRLEIQRQPKVRPETVVVNLRLPDGATGVRAPGWAPRADHLVWKRVLRSDVVLEVTWQE